MGGLVVPSVATMGSGLTASFSSAVVGNGLTGSFTDTSTDSAGVINSWQWDFGDGASSTSQNPTHAYVSGTATYLVRLTASDGVLTNTTSSLFTLPNIAPTARFSSTFVPQLTGSFTDQSSDFGGTVTAWQWDFGDGVTSTSQNPSHVYATAGTKLVSLTATDNQGATNVRTGSLAVYTYVLASFSSSFTPQLTASFTDTTTGGPTAWSWDFGDGTTSTSQNPVHLYAAGGTYPVSLTASNPANSSIATANVAVAAYVLSSFSASLSQQLTMSFTDTTNNTPTAWSWDFGDGTTSTSQNPTKAYATGGSYVVSLTASNAANSSISSQTVKVVRVDGPNNAVYLPQTANEWAALGLPRPMAVWTCQEATGNLADSIGSGTLTPALSPIYQQATTGWTRKSVRLFEVSGERFGLAVGATSFFPGPSIVQSVAMLVYATVDSSSFSATRVLMTPGDSNVNQLQVVFTNAGRLGIQVGSTVSSGTQAIDHRDGLVHPFLVVYDRTAGVAKLLTDDQLISGSFITTCSGSNRSGIGPGGLVAAPSNFVYAAWFTGSTAEALGRETLRGLGWNVTSSYT